MFAEINDLFAFIMFFPLGRAVKLRPWILDFGEEKKSIPKRVMAWLHAFVYERRLRELVRSITPHLHEGDVVLDVGCGSGALGKAIMNSQVRPQGVRVQGLERVRHTAELIEIHRYDGVAFPYADKTYDVLILADVLHHESDCDGLLRECIRVTRRLIIIKDHQVQGLLSQQRISLLDWAANHPYGVACIYKYKTPAEWTDFHRRHGLAVIEELSSMRLYPCVLNSLFGGRLQYFLVAQVPEYETRRPQQTGIINPDGSKLTGSYTSRVDERSALS